MTNGDKLREKLREKLKSDIGLAEFVIDCDGRVYYTIDGAIFWNYDEAEERELEWLKEEAK